MIEVKGSFDEIKIQMKDANKSIADEIKHHKKRYRKEGHLPRAVQEIVDGLAAKARIYSVSKVLPVQVENLMINYKLYEAFTKKLKGFEYSILVVDDGVIIQYWKRRTLAQGKGMLKLYDISKYFKNFHSIPEAVLNDGQEA